MKIVILKPDAIGDFMIASGGIRLLADEYGEENLTLAVHSAVEPLARREFAKAKIISLPIKPRKKGQNAMAKNLYYCAPALWQLLRLRADAMVCLRSRRNFLATLFFLCPRTKGRRIASENPLIWKKGKKRGAVEKWMRRLFRPTIVKYPEAREGMPSDLGAHRVVVGEVLGREIAEEEIMPRLACVERLVSGDYWLLCPFSSNKQKDYSLENWVSALREVADFVPAGGIRLSGDRSQHERVKEFVGGMKAAGLGFAVEVNEVVPLQDFLDVVAGAELVLSVDTAASHLACALRVPMVAVACGINPGDYLPYNPGGRQFWLVGDWDGVGKNRWQETVPPAEVAETIRRTIERR